MANDSTDKAKQSKQSKQDDKKAGEDKSRTLQTSKEAEEKQDETSTQVEERGETDAKAAASGGSVGAVRDGDVVGDSGQDDDDDSFVEFVAEEDELQGAEGFVVERNAEGDEYEVPYVHLTSEHVARTSDWDDPARSWTAQEASGERQDEDGNDLDPVALVEVTGTPGQTFRVRELPNREVAEAAGIDYEQFVATLPVRLDVPDEAPRRGTPA